MRLSRTLSLQVESPLFYPFLILSPSLLEPLPLRVASMPGMEDVIAQVSAYHLPHEVRVLGSAVRAGGVVFIGVHNLAAVARDDRVRRLPHLILAV